MPQLNLNRKVIFYVLGALLVLVDFGIRTAPFGLIVRVSCVVWHSPDAVWPVTITLLVVRRGLRIDMFNGRPASHAECTFVVTTISGTASVPSLCRTGEPKLQLPSLGNSAQLKMIVSLNPYRGVVTMVVPTLPPSFTTRLELEAPIVKSGAGTVTETGADVEGDSWGPPE